MDYTINISLGDVLNSFIGAFFGFGLTLLIEWIVSCAGNHALVKKSLVNIKIELNDIEKALSESCDDDELLIDIPIWETIVQSGGILLLAKKDYYLVLLRTYSKIKILIDQEKNDECALNDLVSYREEVRGDIAALLDLL